MKYELNNDTRKYFGILPLKENWNRIDISELITLVFDDDKIVKILNYSHGYVEIDTNQDTIGREVLVPKTTRGKKQKLILSTILKIRGSGVTFTVSFVGGGITAFDNRRNVFFIKSYSENNEIGTWEDIDRWVEQFIKECPSDYFTWLHKQQNTTRANIKTRPGDIIAFNIGRFEYAFARVLLTDFLNLNFGGRPLLILPYSYTSNTLNINLDELLNKPTLKPIQINDDCVYYGESPIVGFKELTELELSKIGMLTESKYLGIPFTKMDILQMNNRW